MRDKEAALGYVRGIEDDYQRWLLEAHIRGAIREITEQITELVSSHYKMVENQSATRCGPVSLAGEQRGRRADENRGVHGGGYFRVAVLVVRALGRGC